ncbi:hypothetical protein JCM8795_08650 [Hydrogenobaculum acidophilum]
MAFVKIDIPLKAPKKPIYITTIKQELAHKNLAKRLFVKKEPKKEHEKSIKNIKHYRTSKSKKIGQSVPKINYNLTVPSTKRATTESYNTSSSSTSSKGHISKLSTNPSQNINKPSKNKEKPSNQKTTQNQQSKENQPKQIMKPKDINTLGSYFDLISYLEVVFHYIHEHCKGEGVLMFDLYKDGTLRLLEVEKGNPSCDSSLQAPPMPESVMENKLQFLINIP